MFLKILKYYQYFENFNRQESNFIKFPIRFPVVKKTSDYYYITIYIYEKPSPLMPKFKSGGSFCETLNLTMFYFM